MSGPGDPDWEGGALARRQGDRFDAGWTRDMRNGWLDEDERIERFNRQVTKPMLERAKYPVKLTGGVAVKCIHLRAYRQGDEAYCPDCHTRVDYKEGFK